MQITKNTSHKKCQSQKIQITISRLLRVTSRLLRVSSKFKSQKIQITKNIHHKKYKSLFLDSYRTKIFLEPSGCRTRRPIRTWLLGPGARSGTNQNAPICSRWWRKSNKIVDTGSKTCTQQASGAELVRICNCFIDKEGPRSKAETKEEKWWNWRALIEKLAWRFTAPECNGPLPCRGHTCWSVAHPCQVHLL